MLMFCWFFQPVTKIYFVLISEKLSCAQPPSTNLGLADIILFQPTHPKLDIQRACLFKKEPFEWNVAMMENKKPLKW